MNGAVDEFLCVNLRAGGGAGDLVVGIHDVENLACFLRQIAEQTAGCALLPLVLDAVGTYNKPQRWADWLSASGLPTITFCATLEDARHWLETHRG